MTNLSGYFQISVYNKDYVQNTCFVEYNSHMQNRFDIRNFIIILAAVLLLFFLYGGSVKSFSFKNPFQGVNLPQVSQQGNQSVRVVDEQSAVVDVVDKLTPSVVTVGIQARISQFDQNDPFGFFNQQQPGPQSNQPQDIGSGFIVSTDGLIVTNKHVVSEQGTYKVITSDGKTYDVQKIYRDPSNDIAILKINASGLKAVELGDSSKIKVGQTVVAIGTPLGEFRGSVTKGIISGIGRGIEAGSPFEGFAERLDNVIQTDAAINPGNSGGPLVNIDGQVIGVDTAVASNAENIGFALPINLIKDALGNFNQTGGFSRPYMGVSYEMISQQAAIRNNLPQGAYVADVVDGPAAKAGIKQGDVITKIDGEKLTDTNTLAQVVAKKKVGQTVQVTIWRDDKEQTINVTLAETPGQ